MAKGSVCTLCAVCRRLPSSARAPRCFWAYMPSDLLAHHCVRSALCVVTITTTITTTSRIGSLAC